MDTSGVKDFPGAGLGEVHYSNKWNDDKMYLNSGYRFNKLNTDALGNVRSQYILPDTLYFVNENGNTFSSKDRNSLNAAYEFQIDSFSSVKVTTRGTMENSIDYNNYYTESLDETGNMVNSSNRRTSGEADKKEIRSSILWKQKFRKLGRTFSLYARHSYMNSQNNGYLLSDNKYYENNLLQTNELVDQQKLNDNTSSNIGSRIAYTEALSKRSILEFNYNLSNNSRQSRRSTFEKNGVQDKYDAIVDSLSNEYSFKSTDPCSWYQLPVCEN